MAGYEPWRRRIKHVLGWGKLYLCFSWSLGVKKYLECARVVTWLRERTPSVISETTSPSFFQVISADGTGGLASLLHVTLTSLPFWTFTLTIHDLELL